MASSSSPSSSSPSSSHAPDDRREFVAAFARRLEQRGVRCLLLNAPPAAAGAGVDEAAKHAIEERDAVVVFGSAAYCTNERALGSVALAFVGKAVSSREAALGSVASKREACRRPPWRAVP